MSPVRHWVLLALVLGWLALTHWPALRACAGRWDAWVQRHPHRVGAALLGLFVLLVAGGVTGSSWPLLTQGREGALLAVQGSHAHVGELRFIRSDEWGILTTNALAQWNHAPRFPVVNTLLGSEGQNMGVIGMTGTPIAQWAALARPATWGYFFLPLRQAMAWHWQFAFFACLFVLWRVLGVLLPSRQGFNLLLAAGFCTAPYAAGWSLWPLYAAFFPLALFLSLAGLLQTPRLTRALALGAAMGVLLAGWVLVLYPPWQITTGSFVALLALGWLIDQRLHLRWGAAQWWGLALALALAALLLGSWWLDTGEAVTRMRATVYPGNRTALTGGDIQGAPWWTLRGYLDTEVLAGGLSAQAQALAPTVNVNESELSAYFLLPLPLLLLGGWWALRAVQLRWTLRACMAFIAFWLVFRFVGVPLWLANATLWGQVTGVRLDLALGLASTVLLALLWASWPQQVRPRWWLAACVALASAVLVLLEFAWLPEGLLPASSPPLRGALASALGAAAWWVMRARLQAAAATLLLLGLVATLGFNPWSRAPRSVQLAPPVAALAAQHGQLQRTLVISGDAKASVTLLAAGVPVVNAVLYYPQPLLWRNMGLTPADWSEVNRYQHLNFSLAPISEDKPPFQVRGQMDFVKVTIDPLRFDFASTGAQRVVASSDAAPQLRANGHLRELGEHGGYIWFALRGAAAY